MWKEKLKDGNLRIPQSDPVPGKFVRQIREKFKEYKQIDSGNITYIVWDSSIQLTAYTLEWGEEGWT